MTEQPHTPSTTPSPDQADQPDQFDLSDTGDVPWAMQLVVLVDKSAPPSRTAVCRAAATATVRLLTDERAQPGGPWAPALSIWMGGQFRKHCRRARGAAWQRASALPGVTADVAGAQVRVYPPTPVDAIDPVLAKLQLSGTELDDPDQATALDPAPGGPVVVSITPSPFLPLGKAAAAAAHAAQLTAMRLQADDPDRFAVWASSGFDVLVEHPDTARWDQLRSVAPVQIVDAGFTVVEPGTTTAIARWA